MDADSHKKRMREIQKRKEERRKKQIFKNRCIAVVFCVLVLALIVFGVKSCVSGIIKNAAEKKAAQVTASPMPSNTPVPKDASGIAQDFFKESVFVGNSFIDGMVIYDLIDGADYFAKVGLNVKSATTDSTETGSRPVIEELNSTKVYKKIFMMFGENELGWPNPDIFADEYSDLIKKAKQYQPESEIYLLSITPVSEEVSKTSTDGTTNENVIKYNKLIKQLAKEENVVYCDIYDAVVNDSGALPKDAATDGIHFDSVYYKKCLIYIQEHYSGENISDNSSSSSSGKTSYSNDSGSSSASTGSSSGASSSSSSGSSQKSSSSSNSGSSSSKNSGSSSGSTSSGSSSSGSSSSGSSSSAGSSSGSSSSSSSGSSSSGTSSGGSGSSASSGSSGNSSSNSASKNVVPSKSLDE